MSHAFLVIELKKIFTQQQRLIQTRLGAYQILYLVTFSLPTRTRTLSFSKKDLHFSLCHTHDNCIIFLRHFSPVSVNGDSGDLGPRKSRLCLLTSNRLIKPWTWDTPLLVMLRGLNGVKVTWARFESFWAQIWGWDTVADFDSGICSARSLLTWLTISRQNCRLLSM